MRLKLLAACVLLSVSCLPALGQRFVKTADNLAQLKAFNTGDLHTNVFLLGRTNSNDGGGGILMLQRNSVLPVNDITVFAPNVGAGRYLRQYSGAINVRWAGAKGDGNNDDTAAIQACINLVTNAGGSVYFPPGQYLVTGLVLGGGGIDLFGDSGGHGRSTVSGTVEPTSRIVVSGANYALVIGSDPNNAQSGFGIHDLGFEGNGTAKAGIRIGNTSTASAAAVNDITIERCTFRSFTSTTASHPVVVGQQPALGAAGIFFRYCTAVNITDCYFHGNYRGIFEQSEHGATTTTFTRCSFRNGTGEGVLITDCISFKFDKCTFESNQREGFKAQIITNNAAIQHLALENSYFENNNQTGASSTNVVTLDGGSNPTGIYFPIVRGLIINYHVNARNGVFGNRLSHAQISSINGASVIAGNLSVRLTNSFNCLLFTTPADTNPAQAPTGTDAGVTVLKAAAGDLQPERTITMPNAIAYRAFDTGGTARNLTFLDAGDNAVLQGGVGGDIFLKGNNANMVWQLQQSNGALKWQNTSNVFIPVTGTPEGANTEVGGSLAVRLDSSAGATLYVKETAAFGNTGWSPVLTASSAAPIGAPYITAGNTASLTAERALAGTANQIIATDGGANSAMTLSTPQDIAPTSSVTFTNVIASTITTPVVRYGVGLANIRTYSSGNTSVGGAVNSLGLLTIDAGGGAIAYPQLVIGSQNLQSIGIRGSLEYDGSKFYVTPGPSPQTNRYEIAMTVTASAVLDFDLTAVASQDLTITIPLAGVTDAVAIGVPNASVTADTLFWGWVSATNTVTIRAMRTAGTPNPGSGTFKATVIKN